MKDILKNLSIRQKNYLVLAGICLVLYGFNLPYSVLQEPHFVGGNDFKAHAHLMLSYAESFSSGQWIPRTDISPALFNDAALPAEFAPIFQYYGFFEGLLALPFHFLHFSPATAAVGAVISARILGAFVMYETCCLFGATPMVAILANFAFLISPYTMSCFYSRGALAESISHSLLVLIFYGFALGRVQKYRQSILIFAIAFATLSLCHNIFLLYGIVLLLILLFTSFRWRAFLAGGVGSTLGVLITSWQWLPMQQTVGETTFGRMSTWKIPDVISTETHSASWSGAIGFPQKFTTPWDNYSYEHYFTIACWSLPLVVLLVFVPKEKRVIAFSIFAAALAFLALTFAPMSTYLFQNWLPGFFNIVQNSYRLLSFVSLISAFALAIVVPAMKTKAVFICAFLMIISQMPVLWNYSSLVRQEIVSIDAIRGAPINAYYSTLPSPKRIRTETGLLDSLNLFSVSSPNIREFSLHLVGVREPVNSVLVYIAEVIAGTPEVVKPVTEMKELGTESRNFDLSFDSVSVPTEKSIFRLIAIDKVTGNSAVIVPQGFFLYEGPMSRYVTVENLAIEKPQGYSREFRVKPSILNREVVKPNDGWILELPIVFSPLFRAYQNGVILESFVDFNHRMRVKVGSLSSPVIVKFHWSPVAVWLTIISLLGIILVWRWNSIFKNKVITLTKYIDEGEF